MKLISWNVNGLRACLTKGFLDFLEESNADILCVQETKMQESQAEFDTPGYFRYFNSAEKKGYSGTMVLTKKEPIRVTYGMGIDEHDNEGRMITAEFSDFYLVCVYTPNSKEGLARIDYRMEWEDDFRAFVSNLNEKKAVIICGDLNVAHTPIDLKNPKSNEKNAGYSPQEREKFTKLLEAGFTDTFRHFYPDTEGAYSWWSYRFHAREKNAGWRIDYFLTSKRWDEKLVNASILNDIYGSDHCPVELTITL